MKKLSTFLSGAMAILLAGSACTQRPSNTYVVHGILPDSTSNGDTIYLYDREAKLKIDSAVITNNSFTCTGQVDTIIRISFWNRAKSQSTYPSPTSLPAHRSTMNTPG